MCNIERNEIIVTTDSIFVPYFKITLLFYTNGFYTIYPAFLFPSDEMVLPEVNCIVLLVVGECPTGFLSPHIRVWSTGKGAKRIKLDPWAEWGATFRLSNNRIFKQKRELVIKLHVNEKHLSCNNEYMAVHFAIFIIFKNISSRQNIRRILLYSYSLRHYSRIILNFT